MRERERETTSRDSNHQIQTHDIGATPLKSTRPTLSYRVTPYRRPPRIVRFLGSLISYSTALWPTQFSTTGTITHTHTHTTKTFSSHLLLMFAYLKSAVSAVANGVQQQVTNSLQLQQVQIGDRWFNIKEQLGEGTIKEADTNKEVVPRGDGRRMNYHAHAN